MTFSSVLILINFNSDPLAYDDLIRQHQTIAEREAEGRKRGWAGTLEASLLRSEARMAKADPFNPKYKETVRSPISSIDATHAQRKGPLIDWTIDNSDSEEGLDDENETVKNDGRQSQVESAGNTKKSLRLRLIGQEKWRDLIAQRFIDGCDNDFDYAAVDLNLSIDEDWAREQSEEDWFEKEDDHLEGHEGETGVQDF